MRTDTEYLRGLADNENLPSLMRDTLRTAAAEIETLRADWVRMEWLADRENTIGTSELLGGLPDTTTTKEKCNGHDRNQSGRQLW